MFAVLFLGGHEFKRGVGDERVVTPGGEQLGITSWSSIESPPATIPATARVIFAPGFAPALHAQTGRPKPLLGSRM